MSKPTKSKIFVETSTTFPTLAGMSVLFCVCIQHLICNRIVELDNLISTIPSAHFVASPVFGAPAAASAAQLLIVMSGDYRSKKEVAHILHPAVGRKVMDLGGNVEKGTLLLRKCG